MNAKIVLHIYAKASKANVAGRLPIYVRITIEGRRLEYSLKKFVDPKLWSSKQSKLKGTSQEACILNNHLEVVRNKINSIHLEMVHQGQSVTIEEC